MGDLHVKYLLVGGGVAAYSAAVAIRERDRRGDLLLVGQEINRPYDRTQLSKAFLRRTVPRSQLFACEPDWYRDQNIQLRTGRRAVHLDPNRRVVTLDDGQAVAYDRLLLATGAVARPLAIPGGQAPGVHLFRTIEDAERLHTAIDKAHHDGRKHLGGRGKAVVIGAGLLGVEVAAALAAAELRVDLIARHKHPWPKLVGETTGSFLSHYLAAHGLHLHQETGAQRIDGDGRAQRVVLDNGQSLECDFVVAAIGAVANKDLLRGTSISAEQAILADEHCRTSVADIFAAGDCAAVRDTIFNRHRVPEQWDTAAATGTVAGANMAGAAARFETVTSLATDVFGLNVRAWGQSKHLARRLIRGSPNVEAPDFLEIGVAADGRISQILAVGHGGEYARLEKIVRSRCSINGYEEQLKDPAFALEQLVKT